MNEVELRKLLQDVVERLRAARRIRTGVVINYDMAESIIAQLKHDLKQPTTRRKK